MADPDPDSNLDAGRRPDRESTGIPRWVWLAGITAVVVILLVVVVVFALGGHGIGPPPGGH